VALTTPPAPPAPTVTASPAPVVAMRTPADDAKALGLRVGVIVLVALIGSFAAGYAITAYGAGGTVSGLKDVALLILALIYAVYTLVLAVVLFALAFAIGHYGAYLPQGVRWVSAKTSQGETVVDGGLERVVVRPLARTQRLLTTSKTFVARALSR
jgi:hypothetical protein